MRPTEKWFQDLIEVHNKHIDELEREIQIAKKALLETTMNFQKACSHDDVSVHSAQYEGSWYHCNICGVDSDEPLVIQIS
jgi:hypothetical protein